MVPDEVASNVKGRLEDYITLTHSGKHIQLQTKLYKKWFKQISQSNATDDIDIETDMCLLMVDFTPIQVGPGMPEKVTKAYMICPINLSEIDEKTARHIANERLTMDFARLREANISIQENFF